MRDQQTDKRSGRHLRIDTQASTTSSVRSMGWLKLALSVLFMISLFTGCGSTSEKSTATNSESLQMELAETATDTGFTGEAKTEQPKKESNNQTTETDSSGIAPVPSQQDRKLIYRANLVMQVAEYEETKTRINDIIHLANGYTLQFSDQITEYERGGSFVIKIPSAGFQSVLDQLNKLEHMKFERSFSADDVTEEYVDLTSRLKARRVNEGRLISYLEKAQNSKELLEISNKLAAEQEIIEQIVGRMRYLDNNVAMSTIELRLYETVQERKSGLLKQTFGERIGDTLEGSLAALLSIVQGSIIVIVALAPFLVVVLILLVPILLLTRKSRRMRKQGDYRTSRHKSLNASLLDEQAETQQRVEPPSSHEDAESNPKDNSSNRSDRD